MQTIEFHLGFHSFCTKCFVIFWYRISRLANCYSCPNRWPKGCRTFLAVIWYIKILRPGTVCENFVLFWLFLSFIISIT